ncbi:hypothetical protein [Scytonema sp. PRP1]|uniref:hypothetical protein n=1 Tax=Scytonema sp. PRP1 TaxID=3120513 RepID=UPI00300C4083
MFIVAIPHHPIWLWGILFLIRIFFFTRARGGGRCSSRAVGQWRRLSDRGNEIDKANLRKCWKFEAV